jgi:arylsulfatase A-like enzyme
MTGPLSLVLITVDCLRADHVGFLGYAQPTTPFLDSLAPTSAVFRNAVVAGTPTYYSFPAILASRYPLALGRDLVGLAPGEDTLASALNESGFQTAAFVAANPYLSQRFGYDQGFHVFNNFLTGSTQEANLAGVEQSGKSRGSRANQFLRDVSHAWGPSGVAYDELYFQYCRAVSGRENETLDSLRKFPSADVVVDHAIGWLNNNAGAPFFLWLHLMDLHSPYYPKPQAREEMGDGSISGADARYLNSYWTRRDLSAARLRKKRNRIVALYDAGIRWVDTQVRRLAEKLVDMNVWDKCMLAVTADHGEEFLEHGGRFHSPVKLTEELVRVPLLLCAPGGEQGIFDQPLSLIDLAPTLLEGLNVAVPASFRGRSLWRHLTGDKSWNGPVFTECAYGCTNPLRTEDRVGPRILAVRSGDFKLVVNFSSGTEQLFNLISDPLEQSSLPHNAELMMRRRLLECAREHVAESHQSRDFNHRLYSQLREHRLEWAHSPATTTN